MCCEIFTVIGKHILCDKRVCCVPGIVSKQQPELSSAALTTWVFLDRFPFIPIRTRNHHRRLPQLNLKLDGEIGIDLVSTNQNHDLFQMNICTSEPHFSICANANSEELWRSFKKHR